MAELPNRISRTTENMAVQEDKFHQSLRQGQQKVLLYEDPELLNLAYTLIPAEIKERTVDHKDNFKDEIFLTKLMDWFKNSFFSWVDRPKCQVCNNTDSSFVENAQPNLSEQAWLAGRVEVYRCKGCSSLIRFPRYNHPRKLLQERRGRCGEWSNCFTLMCRASGFEARFVLDWTDHVWTEVFSKSHDRWIHLDPCEARLDCPLLYEVGWGKKLTYVIAFSKDEVQDVTWRYTTNHKETLSRRNLCREGWLVHQILQMTEKLQNYLPKARRDELILRRIKELVELMKEPVVSKQDELSGRTSGSLEWRIQRNEQGKQQSFPKYVFSLMQSEASQKLLHVKYSAARNVYLRASCKDVEMSGWNKCVYEYSSVFRKVEHDWKMAYLAREEGSKEAFIKWAFDFKGTGHHIRTVNILCESETFENGNVKWMLTSPNRKTIILNGGKTVNKVELEGAEEFTLEARLSGGRGSVAWQHTQLFRQPLDSDYYPFEVQVLLV